MQIIWHPTFPMSGIVSSIAWDNPDLHRVLEQVFTVRAGERIAWVEVTPEGLRAIFERISDPEQKKPTAMREIADSLEAGKITREEAGQRLGQILGNKGCRRKEQLYDCGVCLDTGKVDVWSDELIADFIERGVHPNDAKYRDMTCACFCKHGEKFLKRARPLQRVDPDRHCIIEPRGGASTVPVKPEAIANLLKWINERTQRAAKAQREQDPLFHQGGR